MRHLDQFFRLDPYDCPLRPERMQDHRLDDHHDLVRIGVVRADLRALVGIEKALKQGAENGGVNQAPVKAGRRDRRYHRHRVEWPADRRTARR